MLDKKFFSQSYYILAMKISFELLFSIIKGQTFFLFVIIFLYSVEMNKIHVLVMSFTAIYKV